jgi:rare lipoprotein A
MVRRIALIVVASIVALMLGIYTAGAAQAQEMFTTYYGPGYCGNTTASGDVFDCGAMTAAHPHLPFGTVLEVCYDECATVTVNDRGPTLDLSPAAAELSGILHSGTGVAEVKIL